MNICLNLGALYTGEVPIFGDVRREYSNSFCHFTEDLQKMSESEIFLHTYIYVKMRYTFLADVIFSSAVR